MAIGSQLPGEASFPPTKSTKYPKLFIIVVVFLLILLVSGGSYYVLFMNDTNTSSISSLQPTQPALSSTQTASNETETLPDEIPSPSPAISPWKQYKTAVYTMNYLPSWKFDYYSIPDGVQVYNPGTIPAASSSSAVLSPTQYVTVATLISSESAIMYANKIQVACCIGPSAPPQNASKFQIKSIIIGGRSAVAYTPIDTIRKWDIVLSTGKHILLIYSSIVDPNGVTTENQMISSIQLLE